MGKGLSTIAVLLLSLLAAATSSAQPRIQVWSLHDRCDEPPSSSARSCRRVNPQIDALTPNSREWELRLPGRRPVVAVRDRVRLRGDGSFVWTGKIGKTGSASFTRLDKALVGNFTTSEGRRYRLRFSSTSGYALEEVNPRFFEVNEQSPTPAPPIAAPAGTACTTDLGDVVDVLVVYTSAALSDAGSIAHAEAWVAQAEDEANAALVASGVDNVRIRVVHVGQVSYSEGSKNGGQVWDDLAAGSGMLGAAHQMRDDVGADIVVLVVELPESVFFTGLTGFTFQSNRLGDPVALSSQAFAVVSQWSLTTPNVYSFAHELGHIMGAQHEDSAGQPFPFSRDHISPPSNPPNATCPKGWRTLMSSCNNCLDCSGAACVCCPMIGAWSNTSPTLTHCSEPMGKLDVEDNALAIMKTASTVANIRCSIQK